MSSLALFAVLAAQADVTRDVVYREVGDTKLMADVYLPPGHTAESAKIPWVVVIHGGSWMTGKRQDMDSLARGLAGAGYGAVTITYRLAPANRWPSMLQDSQAAVRFFKEHATEFGFDRTRVGSAGASAGGHLAMLLGFRDSLEGDKKSSRVNAVVNLFGPTDMSKDFPAALGGFMAQQIIGKKLEDAAEDIKDFSPVTFITPDDAPVYTIHGDADTLVPIKQAERLDAALKAAGIEHTFVVMKGMGHESPEGKPGGPEAIAGAIKFLDKHLKN